MDTELWLPGKCQWLYNSLYANDWVFALAARRTRGNISRVIVLSFGVHDLQKMNIDSVVLPSNEPDRIAGFPLRSAVD